MNFQVLLVGSKFGTVIGRPVVEGATVSDFGFFNIASETEFSSIRLRLKWKN